MHKYADVTVGAAHAQFVALRLRQYLRREGMSQGELAQATGVNQSQISRIVHGRPKRISNAMQVLCSHAGIEWRKPSNDPTRHPELMAAVSAAWDGTDAGAEALARLLSAVADFAGKGKKEDGP